ncbi:hypothetical protein AB0M54_39650 [Actinoplanes sp. NPDC051470]|uniref:hypothetical protein n=1 Tax=Actinoplanes sp. NPDC051470 TaxID=3157224 RepID=UPI003414444E
MSRRPLATARRLEQEALALGDELLVQRARLCAVAMLMRTGELATAARQICRMSRPRTPPPASITSAGPSPPIPWHLVAGELAVTISAGVASGSSSLPELLSEADRNLYAAKHAGRDRVVFRPAA